MKDKSYVKDKIDLYVWIPDIISTPSIGSKRHINIMGEARGWTTHVILTVLYLNGIQLTEEVSLAQKYLTSTMPLLTHNPQS